MERVLVDTSAWVEAIRSRGEPDIAERVRQAVAAGAAVLCDPVLLELWNGAHRDDERQVRELETTLERVPVDEEIWAGARALARSCRRAGVSVPAMDLLIAACAEQHGLALLHRDRHFDEIARVRRL